MATDDLLRLVAPEFFKDDEQASAEEERREYFLAEANRQIAPNIMGDSRDHAVALLAAHMLKIAARSGNPGRVSSLKEGQLAISFSGFDSAVELASTSYGMELLRIRRAWLIGARTQLV